MGRRKEGRGREQTGTNGQSLVDFESYKQLSQAGGHLNTANRRVESVLSQRTGCFDWDVVIRAMQTYQQSC